MVALLSHCCFDKWEFVYLRSLGSGGYGADVMEISTCTYMEGRAHVRREILGQDRGGRITRISRNLTFMVP